MPSLPQIFVGPLDYDPALGTLTGLTATVQYDEAQAAVSILKTIHLSASEALDAGIRAELLRLGQAIIQAAQSPQGISEHPFPRHSP
jgi:hypothetical protein